MRKLATLGILMLTATLNACGGGDDAFGNGGGGGGVNPNVASISVSSSTASILNDGTQTATITAFVRAANNALLPNVTVTFASSSGGITPGSAPTDASGQVTATLSTAGDSTIRTVTVTAATGSFTATVPVQVVAAQPPAVVGTLTLTTSTPTIPSDNSLSATITAVARDTSNRFLANVPVVFTSTSGGVAVTGTGLTNASGQASATLTTPGEPQNRTITVSAAAQSVTQTVNIAVIGTTLGIQGPSSLVLGAQATYTVTLADSAARGIAGRALTVASSAGNTLSATALTTDSQGRATFNLTVTQSLAEVITVAGLGLTATQNVAVNADSFSFTTPAADNAEVPLGTSQNLSVTWLTGGAPAAGRTVTFSTTRGTLVPANGVATTNASGVATVTVSSSNAGAGTVTATGTGVTAQRIIEFVATAPASIDVQPGVFTLSPSTQTPITAIVRDAQSNLVKNVVVSFSVVQDTTGGNLSVGSAITDSQGRAQSVYTAGSTASGQNGVTIRASVLPLGGGPAITRDVQLTVATRAVSISLGTGNTITEPSVSQYSIEYTIQVTDANGNGVAGVPLTVSVVSLNYVKGRHVFAGGTWSGYDTPVYVCQDEDTLNAASTPFFRNSVLDTNAPVNEDVNGNGRIDAGNIALVTPNSVTTNAQGIALVEVRYPQDHAYWLEVQLEARTTVQGTEAARSTSFVLPGAANDFNQQNTAPPGLVSPFGVNDCNVPN